MIGSTIRQAIKAESCPPRIHTSATMTKEATGVARITPSSGRSSTRTGQRKAEAMPIAQPSTTPAA